MQADAKVAPDKKRLDSYEGEYWQPKEVAKRQRKVKTIPDAMLSNGKAGLYRSDSDATDVGVEPKSAWRKTPTALSKHTYSSELEAHAPDYAQKRLAERTDSLETVVYSQKSAPRAVSDEVVVEEEEEKGEEEEEEEDDEEEDEEEEEEVDDNENGPAPEDASHALLMLAFAGAAEASSAPPPSAEVAPVPVFAKRPTPKTGAGVLTGMISNPWEPEEDDALKTAIAKHGTRWKNVARDVLEQTGAERTVAMCRNRYLRIQAGLRQAALNPTTNNRCTACGQFKKGHTCRGVDAFHATFLESARAGRVGMVLGGSSGRALAELRRAVDDPEYDLANLAPLHPQSEEGVRVVPGAIDKSAVVSSAPKGPGAAESAVGLPSSPSSPSSSSSSSSPTPTAGAPTAANAQYNASWASSEHAQHNATADSAQQEAASAMQGMASMMLAAAGAGAPAPTVGSPTPAPPRQGATASPCAPAPGTATGISLNQQLYCPWALNEDMALKEAIRTHGTRWATIAARVAELTGIERTVAMCRNRYLRIQAAALKAEKTAKGNSPGGSHALIIQRGVDAHHGAPVRSPVGSAPSPAGRPWASPFLSSGASGASGAPAPDDAQDDDAQDGAQDDGAQDGAQGDAHDGAQGGAQDGAQVGAQDGAGTPHESSSVSPRPAPSPVASPLPSGKGSTYDAMGHPGGFLLAAARHEAHVASLRELHSRERRDERRGSPAGGVASDAGSVDAFTAPFPSQTDRPTRLVMPPPAATDALEGLQASKAAVQGNLPSPSSVLAPLEHASISPLISISALEMISLLAAQQPTAAEHAGPEGGAAAPSKRLHSTTTLPPCPLCHRTFLHNNSSARNSHVARCANAASLPGQTPNAALPENDPVNVRGAFRCRESGCAHVYANLDGLRRHARKTGHAFDRCAERAVMDPGQVRSAQRSIAPDRRVTNPWPATPCAVPSAADAAALAAQALANAAAAAAIENGTAPMQCLLSPGCTRGYRHGGLCNLAAARKAAALAKRKAELDAREDSLSRSLSRLVEQRVEQRTTEPGAPARPTSQHPTPPAAPSRVLSGALSATSGAPASEGEEGAEGEEGEEEYDEAMDEESPLYDSAPNSAPRAASRPGSAFSQVGTFRFSADGIVDVSCVGRLVPRTAPS